MYIQEKLQLFLGLKIGEKGEIFFDPTLITCAKVHEISANYGYYEEECENLCDDEDECMFYFFDVNSECLLYKSCDYFRIPTFRGSTHKKIKSYSIKSKINVS